MKDWNPAQAWGTHNIKAEVMADKITPTTTPASNKRGVCAKPPDQSRASMTASQAPANDSKPLPQACHAVGSPMAIESRP
jgi:hypothetical protein